MHKPVLASAPPSPRYATLITSLIWGGQRPVRVQDTAAKELSEQSESALDPRGVALVVKARQAIRRGTRGTHQ